MALTHATLAQNRRQVVCLGLEGDHVEQASPIELQGAADGPSALDINAQRSV